MSKPDGGYAFPSPIAVGPAGDVYAVVQAEFGTGGMTLRDYFAAKSLAAIIQADGAQYFDRYARHAAWAYAQADAMLAERASAQHEGHGETETGI